METAPAVVVTISKRLLTNIFRISAIDGVNTTSSQPNRNYQVLPAQTWTDAGRMVDGEWEKMKPIQLFWMAYSCSLFCFRFWGWWKHFNHRCWCWRTWNGPIHSSVPVFWKYAVHLFCDSRFCFTSSRKSSDEFTPASKIRASNRRHWIQYNGSVWPWTYLEHDSDATSAADIYK